MRKMCSAPLVSTGDVRPGILCLFTGSSIQERHDMGQLQQRAVKLSKSLKHICYEERLTVLGLFFRLKKRRLKKEFSNTQKHLKGGCKEGKLWLFSVVPRDWIKVSVHNLKYRLVHLSTRKHFFTVGVTHHWHLLPMEVVDLPPWIYSKAIWVLI